jgi:ATP-binding cassette subfamily B protein
MGIGDLVAFIGYLNLLAWPTLAMGWMLSIVQRGRAALQRLEHIFGTEPEIRDAENATALPSVRGRIEYRDVCFSYSGKSRDRRRGIIPGVENGAQESQLSGQRNGDADISGISFVVEPGQKLGIVGKTGAGKSTLVSLLPRLFDVSSGSILLDGRDVRQLPLEQLRRSVAFVPQDPFLFSTRIADNIGFGIDDADDDQIRSAAEIAAVAEDLEQFAKGYQTVIGERGITLSGGQKQRLTLARALACDPTVLVLDDALSSVDTRTERNILERLREIRQGRTSIVIAHRLSTVMDADHIIVVDEGRIVESGNHESLLRRAGPYADLFQQQKIEEELETL